MSVNVAIERLSLGSGATLRGGLVGVAVDAQELRVLVALVAAVSESNLVVKLEAVREEREALADLAMGVT